MKKENLYNLKHARLSAVLLHNVGQSNATLGYTYFTPQTRTRQDCLVLSASAV